MADKKVNSLFPEKVFHVGDKVFTVRPLSMYELQVTFPGVLERVFQVVDEDPELSLESVAMAASSELMALVSETSGHGKGLEVWKEVPAARGLEILAYFLEVNLSENFTQALGVLKEAWGRLGPKFSSSLSNTATGRAKSKPTP